MVMILHCLAFFFLFFFTKVIIRVAFKIFSLESALFFVEPFYLQYLSFRVTTHHALSGSTGCARGRWLYLCPACSTQQWKIKTNICPLVCPDVSVCARLGFKQVCIEVHYDWPNFNDEGKCYKRVAVSCNLNPGLWHSWSEWRCKLIELAKDPLLIPFMINYC